jgi:hypothetical protein
MISADWISDSLRTVSHFLLVSTLTNSAPTAAQTIVYIKVFILITHEQPY